MADMLFKSRLIGFRRRVPRRNLIVRARTAVYRRMLSRANHVFGSRAVVSPHPFYGGRGYIAGQAEGIVTVNGNPASRRIYLFVRPQMVCVADQWSKDDGSYRFDRLNENLEYLMVGTDYKKQYEPVSYDFVKPYVDSDG